MSPAKRALVQSLIRAGGAFVEAQKMALAAVQTWLDAQRAREDVSAQR